MSSSTRPMRSRWRRRTGSRAIRIVIGEVAGRRVAFVPRHGRDHRFPPHRVPYRANLWALRSLGVRQILAPTAVGSLTAAFGPGRAGHPGPDRGPHHRPYPDLLRDRRGRARAVRRPLLPLGRAQAIAAAKAADWDLADSGTLVVIDGPRFSTRAESRWYAAQGWTLIGMTGHPEAVLARELALCYTALALVTDTDAGVEEGEGVTQDEVFRVFAGNVAGSGTCRGRHRGPPSGPHLPLPERAGRHPPPDRASEAACPGPCRAPVTGPVPPAPGPMPRASVP